MWIVAVGLALIVAAGLFALTEHSARFIWEPRDLWIGCYWRTEYRHAAETNSGCRWLILYLILIPTLVLRVDVKLGRLPADA